MGSVNTALAILTLGILALLTAAGASSEIICMDDGLNDPGPGEHGSHRRSPALVVRFTCPVRAADGGLFDFGGRRRYRSSSRTV